MHLFEFDSAKIFSTENCCALSAARKGTTPCSRRWIRISDPGVEMRWSDESRTGRTNAWLSERDRETQDLKSTRLIPLEKGHL